MSIHPVLWQYLVFFGLGGICALLVRRLVYGTRPSKSIHHHIEPAPVATMTKAPEAATSTFVSRQTLLPKESRLWYRRLHQALGDDHIVVPRVKLSRLITANATSQDEGAAVPQEAMMKLLRSQGVDFVICAPTNLKILAVVRIKSVQEEDPVSEVLKKSGIPEVTLINGKEYSSSELRGIFMTKLLPPTARTLSIAI